MESLCCEHPGINERMGDDSSSLHIMTPRAPAADLRWKENEESNTVRPKTFVDLQTDRLGALGSYQERRQSHGKVQPNLSMVKHVPILSSLLKPLCSYVIEASTSSIPAADQQTCALTSVQLV